MLKGLGSFIACITVLLPTASAVRAADGVSVTQVRVNMTLYEGSADETSRLRARPDKKVLAGPDIVVMLGRPFSMLVGGELGGKNGGDGLEFGTGVRGKIERLGPHTLLVRLRLSLGNAVSIKQAPEIQLVRTTSFEVRAPMNLGQVTRIPCGESQTLEIELVSLATGDLPQTPAPAPGGVSSPRAQ